jgi:hypothetical protein
MERKPAPVALMMVEGVEVVKPGLVEGVVKRPSEPEPVVPVQSAALEEELMPDPSTLDLALPPKPPTPANLE